VITALALSPALDVTYLTDRITLGAIHRPSTVIRLAGGKALNLARAAATLGTDVRVIAPLGGHTGRLVAELAEAAGLHLDVVPVDGETRTCVSIIETDTTATEFYEPPSAIDRHAWQALAERMAVAPPGGWTAVSGRIPDSIPVDELAVALRARGERIAIDGSGAGMRALIEQVQPDLVKINRAEALELVGDRDGIAGLAAAVRAISGGAVIITDGSHGAVAADSTGTWTAAPDPHPGRYGIGSGDSFLAGVLVALDAGRDLAAALAEGSAAGSANARTPGAGVFSRDDVASQSARVRVDSAA
jgi:1-phosphofructokinase family hexose kinase